MVTPIPFAHVRAGSTPIRSGPLAATEASTLWRGESGRLIRLVTLLVTLPLFATLAFMAVEGWGFFDALYMSVITLTTVGYMEVHELSTAGRVLVMLYLIIGLGVFLYGIVQIGEGLVAMQLRDLLGRKKMDNAIRTLEGHLIVCGFGRMGRSLCHELIRAGRRQRFVVIDRDATSIADARDLGYHALCGDATDDELLEQAGIDRAAGLAAVLPSDADNLFVVMSARLLAKDLQILARATGEKAAAKLERAGANRVVSLYETGASKMAQLLTHSQLEDFMQIFTSQGDRLDLAEIVVGEAATYRGVALRNTNFRQRGILVVGLQKPGRGIEMPPSPDSVLDPGDTLVAFGDAGAIGELIAEQSR